MATEIGAGLGYSLIGCVTTVPKGRRSQGEKSKSHLFYKKSESKLLGFFIF